MKERSLEAGVFGFPSFGFLSFRFFGRIDDVPHPSFFLFALFHS
jgi:hypothetical protein